MSVARYSVPICMLKDNFVVAAGGVVSAMGQAKKFTNACEVLDVAKNQWVTVAGMEKPRA